MTGREVDVARIISQEIKKVASSGHKLTFPSLIIGLCRRAGVEIPDLVHINITSVVDAPYVARYFCSRINPRNQLQPQAMAHPQNRYNEQLACRYNWEYFDANRRSQVMINDSLVKLYLH